MSRIGKMPVVIPAGVQIDLANGQLNASGPKGKLSLPVHPAVSVVRDGNVLKVDVKGASRREKSLHGLFRSLINNTVTGVHSGFEKKLEINGVGYQFVMKGTTLEISAGYSKPVVFEIPAGVTCTLADNTHLTVSGADKQVVGQFSAQVRATRLPDPYKAKGVKYQGELIRRKAGKAFGSGTT